ncbi:MAG TPA: hypothetical protein DHW42_00360 [Candidatus Marinimicrobia bacterium]|nr:hypothetical protein [Candidatus Neomarinimicrobiota bacterium]
MTKIDKVIEAEEAILDIANELKKIKDSANLLDSAQHRVDEVIKISAVIIDKTEKFVNKETEIVNRIGDYDIQSDIHLVLEQLSSINENIKILLKNSDGLPNKISEIALSVQNLRNDVIKGIDNIEKTHTVFSKKIRLSNSIILSIISINLLLTVFLFLKLFAIL